MNKSKIINTLPLNESSIAGMTMTELITAMAITGVTAAIAAPSISFGKEPLSDSTNRVSSAMKLARSKAMAQTSAFRVSPNSNNELTIARAATCDAASGDWTSASGLLEEDRKLDKGVVFSAASENGTGVLNPASDWSICFDSRGMANKILNLTIFNTEKNQSQRVQVFRGGTLEVS